MSDRHADIAVSPASASPVVEERLRRCIVGGVSRPRGQMIRYVVHPEPDGAAIVPDIDARLPGRGLWTEARRDIVAAAVAKRAFARAAGTQVKVPADLDERVAALLARRVLDLVGMARRGRLAIAGFDPACEALARGDAGFLLLAADASPAAKTKLTALAAAAQVGVAEALSADELGQVFARPRAAQVAILRGALASRIAAQCTRLAGFRSRGAEATSGLESEGL